MLSISKLKYHETCTLFRISLQIFSWLRKPQVMQTVQKNIPRGLRSAVKLLPWPFTRIIIPSLNGQGWLIWFVQF